MSSLISNLISNAMNADMKAFIWPVRVYWEDTDAGGIVFYANYLKYMERARTEWLRSLGIAQSTLREETGGMFVVSQTQLKYQQPARLDDQLLVTAKISVTSKITLTITQEIRLMPTPNLRKQLSNIEQLTMTEETFNALPLVCHGTIRIAWVDASSLKPARIPQHLMEVLQ
jgi:acyl-CoA thioester hydrolase